MGEVPSGDALWVLYPPRLEVLRPSRGGDGLARPVGSPQGRHRSGAHPAPSRTGRARVGAVAGGPGDPRAGAEVTAELHWYADLQGDDAGAAVQRIEGAERGAPRSCGSTRPCHPMRSPSGWRSAWPHPRAAPVVADVDDIALVSWAPAGTPVTAAHTHVDVDAPTSLAVARTVLAGALEWVDAARPPPVRAPKRFKAAGRE